MHKYPYAPVILLLWQTGGEGEHWHPERSSRGSFGTQRGIAVWGSDYGGPEDPSNCHPPHYQLGQTQQTPPGQIQVRIELEEASRSVFSVFICTLISQNIDSLCISNKALAGLQLQVAEVYFRSEGDGGVVDWRGEHFETGREWASSAQTAPQGKTCELACTHARVLDFRFCMWFWRAQEPKVNKHTHQLEQIVILAS